jgi:hypothetical protein
MDNDLVVSKGWIDNLIGSAIENNLNVISPALVEGELDYDLESFAQKAREKMGSYIRLGDNHAVCLLIHKSVWIDTGYFRATPSLLGHEDTLFFFCRVFWFFPVLILLAFRPSALALSEESPVEVTCGSVYSIGTLDAHGGWPRRIQDATRDPSVKYMLHLFYAPFVMVHNPGDKEILYSESELSDAVVFGTPPIALRFERSNGNPTGFVTSVPIALVRMYVRQMYSENPEKTYHFSLADAVNGDTVALAPGETKVFVPDLDENYTVAMDRPGDGNNSK